MAVAAKTNDSRARYASLGYIILKWFISGCTPLTLYTILIISQLLTHILLYIYILFFKNLS